MPGVEWDEFIKDYRLIGGQASFSEGGWEYVGEIRHIKDHGTHAFVSFEWAACKTKTRGWTFRKRYYKKLPRAPIGCSDGEDVPIIVGIVHFLFKNSPHLVSRESVVKPLTKDERRKLRRKERHLPLFERSR